MVVIYTNVIWFTIFKITINLIITINIKYCCIVFNMKNACTIAIRFISGNHAASHVKLTTIPYPSTNSRYTSNFISLNFTTIHKY